MPLTLGMDGRSYRALPGLGPVGVTEFGWAMRNKFTNTVSYVRDARRADREARRRGDELHSLHAVSRFAHGVPHVARRLSKISHRWGPKRCLQLLGISLVGSLVIPTAGNATEAGRLDRSFGHDGRVLTDFFGQHDRAFAVAAQDNGKIVVGGEAIGSKRGNGIQSFAIARYKPNGRLDQGFGHNGRVLVGRCDRGEVRGLAIQPNGRIVAAGICGTDFAAMRFMPDGSLDRSFGLGGKALSDIGGVPSVGHVVLQPDGRIVVAGSTRSTTNGTRVAVIRYKHDGSLDETFDENGYLFTNFGTGAPASGFGGAVQDDGKIVVSAIVGGNWTIARFLPTGAPDFDFGDGGVVFSAPKLSGQAKDVLLEPDGDIVAAGTDYGGEAVRFGVGRYLENGDFDSTFGVGGARYTVFGSERPSDYGNAVALQGDRRILVAGTAYVAFHDRDTRFAIARYRQDGALDRSFGRGGKVTTRFPRRARRRTDAFAQDMTLQDNGRILVVGYSRARGRNEEFAVARYLAR
jgi:uncharacterized delta-60 repeat protein